MHVFVQGGAVGPGAPNPGLGWGVPMDTLLLEPVATPAPQRRTWKSRFLPDRLYDYYQHQVRGQESRCGAAPRRQPRSCAAPCLSKRWARVTCSACTALTLVPPPTHSARFCVLQSAWLLAQLPPEDARYKAIPPQYTRVFPLDVGEATGTTGSFGYVTSVYKVTSSNDGMTYALRRVDNVRAQAGVVQEVMHRWQRVAAAGVIPLRNAFVDHGGAFVGRTCGHCTPRYIGSTHDCTLVVAAAVQPCSSCMTSARAPRACGSSSWMPPVRCSRRARCGRTCASW